MMAEAVNSDPFANDANPFEAIGYNSSARKSASDPFAGGANPFETIGKHSEVTSQSQAMQQPMVQAAEAQIKGMNPVLANIIAAGRGAAQAVPFVNDIAALGHAAASYLPESVKPYIGLNPEQQSGESFGQRYRENLAQQRAINTANEIQRPVASLGGEVVGAFGLPAATATRAANAIGGAVSPYVGAGIARALGSGAVGAGYGALYGAGSADSVADRVAAAERGALLGGAAGATVPVVASGIGNVASRIAPYFGGSAEKAAAGKIEAVIQRDAGIGKAGLSEEDIAAGRVANQPILPVDIGGEATKALGRQAANISPEARSQLTEAAQERFTGQGSRFSQFMQNLFGNNLNSQTVRDRLSVAAESVNSPAYKEAFSKGSSGVWNDELANLVRDPNMAPAIKDATRFAASEAVRLKQPIIKSPFVEDKAGNINLAQDSNGNTIYPSLQFWNQVKRSLDSKIGPLLRSGDKVNAGEYIGLKNSLLNELDNAVPEYAKARSGAHEFFNARNALEAGENFLGMAKSANIDAQKAALNKYSPEDKSFFAQGLASQIMQKSDNASERRNIVNLFNSPETRDKMQLGLGADRANKIEAFLRRENIMDMFRASLGNSTTTRQIVELGLHKTANPIAGAFGGAGLGIYEHGFDPKQIAQDAIEGAIAGAFVKHVRGVNESIAKNVGQMLVSEDPKVMQRAMDIAAKNPRVMDAIRKTEIGFSNLLGIGGQRSIQQLKEIPSGISQQ